MCLKLYLWFQFIPIHIEIILYIPIQQITLKSYPNAFYLIVMLHSKNLNVKSSLTTYSHVFNDNKATDLSAIRIEIKFLEI